MPETRIDTLDSLREHLQWAVRSDGRPQEARNRVTLCRCGHSGNKPLCDGTHREIGFREEPSP